jgi:hypothetical protein
MSNYTEAQLTQMEEGKEIRPRVREAGHLYLTQPENERSYRNVVMTKSDGTPVTQGRIDVYIREYLAAMDLLEEAPRPGRKANGDQSKVNVPKIPGVTDIIEQAIENYRSQVDTWETRVNETQAAVAEFNADEWRQTVAEEIQEEIDALTARLTAWVNNEGDVASDSAEAYMKDLQARADRTESSANEALNFLRPQLDAAEQTLEAATKLLAPPEQPAPAPAPAE